MSDFSSRILIFLRKIYFLAWFLGIGDGESRVKQKRSRRQGLNGREGLCRADGPWEYTGWGRDDTEMDD